jgi:hypothetical protein
VKQLLWGTGRNHGCILRSYNDFIQMKPSGTYSFPLARKLCDGTYRTAQSASGT